MIATHTGIFFSKLLFIIKLELCNGYSLGYRSYTLVTEKLPMKMKLYAKSYRVTDIS